MRPASKSYPALPSIISTLSDSSKDKDNTNSVSVLKSATTEELLSLHTSHHSLESVSLTIEPSNSSTSIWTPATISRLERGDIDPWIESLVIGTTEDEGSVFAYGAKLSNPDNFEKWISRFSKETAQQARDKYLKPFEGGVHPEEAGSKLLSDQIFVNPVWDLAKAVVNNNEKRKVWMYRLRTGVEMILNNSPFGIMCVFILFFFHFMKLD
jgi:carboxylesterase type B